MTLFIPDSFTKEASWFKNGLRGRPLHKLSKFLLLKFGKYLLSTVLELDKTIAGGSKVLRMERTGSKLAKKKKRKKPKERRWWRNGLYFTSYCCLISDKLINVQSLKSLVSCPRNEGILKKAYMEVFLTYKGKLGPVNITLSITA